MINDSRRLNHQRLAATEAIHPRSYVHTTTDVLRERNELVQIVSGHDYRNVAMRLVTCYTGSFAVHRSELLATVTSRKVLSRTLWPHSNPAQCPSQPDRNRRFIFDLEFGVKSSHGDLCSLSCLSLETEKGRLGLHLLSCARGTDGRSVNVPVKVHKN